LADRAKFQAIKGVRDILPPESALWNRVEQTAREVFGTFGFAEIRLPIFEQTELFARSVGLDTDIVNKEMYVFDLYGSFGLEYWRESIPRYPGEVSIAEFDRCVREFLRQIDDALRSDRLQRSSGNLLAIEKVKTLYGQFRESSSHMSPAQMNLQDSWWAELEALGANISDATKEISLGFYVALRPEATASVVRAYIEHGMQILPGNVKLYYTGPMFRRERPQKGRYRQFYQIGAEVLKHVRLVEKVSGTKERMIDEDAATDAEVIEMLMSFFARLRLKGVVLYINSIGDKNCRPAYVEKLRGELQKVREQLGPDSQRRIETNPLRVLDSKLESEQGIIEKLPRIGDHLCDDCRAHYDEVKRQLTLRGIAYQENWRLVRGLDYYMRTTFEITAPGLGSQNAVCGGGRYDGLVELLGGPAATKGIGFAIGTDRLVLSLQEAGEGRVQQGLDVYLAWFGAAAQTAAIGLAKQLREAGFVVELPAVEVKFGKSLGLADRLKARHAVILGDDELAANVVTVKRLSDGVQQKLTGPELLHYLRAESGSS
jgi:histidyl-tRNA synthetase